MKLKTQNRLLLTVHCLLITAVCLFPGCRPQSESDLVRRARLTGSENLRLKKQLKDIEKENAALQAELAKQRDCQQQLEQCRQDLADAPMPCPEVEAEYTQFLERLTTLLMECQQKLEQYEPESTE